MQLVKTEIERLQTSQEHDRRKWFGDGNHVKHVEKPGIFEKKWQANAAPAPAAPVAPAPRPRPAVDGQAVGVST